MSVNNNPNTAPLDNPFADLSSLKNANLDEREEAILSKCNYKDLKTKWSEGLNNISNNAHTHMRNVKEVKESFFCYLGNVLGLANSEPLKEVHKVFSNFDLFDRYVRNDISTGTYKKIAKANPAYFDKVIEHLEDSAKALDIKADARVDTFCSSSTGYALARAATRFRDTADYLKRMMHGDDAAKPGNNNANPGADRGQPTIINHYHNNIGHIGDINIGHLGDNNFYNKGNMAVMFKKSSNGVPHTGFKSEYSVSKTENLFYSPTINGMKLLDVTAKNALKLLGQGEKDESKENKENLEFKAQKPLSKENPENIKQQVDSINLKPEEKENNAVEVDAGIQTDNDEQNVKEDNTMRNLYSEVYVQKTKRNTAIYIKSKVSQEQKNQEAPKNAEKTDKTTDVNAVEQKNDTAKNIDSRLRVLLGKYGAFWDQIHNGKEEDSKDLSKLINGINENDMNKQDKMRLESGITPLREGSTKKQAEQIFTLLDKINDPVRKLKILGHVIERLGYKLSEKNKSGIDNEYTNAMGSILNNIASVISDKDKKTYNEKHGVLEKSESEVVGHGNHGMALQGISYTPTEDEKNLSQGEICNKLYDETKAILKEILPYTFPQANEQKKN